MDTRRRAREFQRWAAVWLEKNGWHVFNAPQRPIFRRDALWCSLRNDIFGADIIARRQNRLLWIQTTHGADLSGRRREFEKHFSCVLLPGEELHVWIKVPRKYVRIYVIAAYTTDGAALFDCEVGRITGGKFECGKTDYSGF